MDNDKNSEADAAPSSSSAAQTEAVLPFDLSTSIESINISGSSGEPASTSQHSGTGVDTSASLSTDLMLNFNVDTLNLDNLSGLSGLDFDVSNLLTQASDEPATAVSSSASVGSLPELLQIASPATVTAASLPNATKPVTTTTPPPASKPPAASNGGLAVSPIQQQQRSSASSSSSADPTTTDNKLTPVRPVNPQRPVQASNTSPSAVRPRPARPPGSTPSAATHPPLSRPPPALGAGRPPAARAPQTVPTGARPRPPQVNASSVASAGARPVARPGVRPRIIVRPTQSGAQQPSVRSPTAGRPPPSQRPAVRPAARPPAASGSATPQRPPSAATVVKTDSLRPQQPEDSSPALTSTAEAQQDQPQKPQSPSRDGTSTSDKSAAAPTKGPSPEVPASAADTDAVEDGPNTAAEEEHCYLTESVTVTCPALIAPPKGLELLYSLTGAFRSLCHGVSPTNAEWSSLNVLAVAWPQLEVAPTAGCRLAQRDVSDVSSMTAADSMRSFEARRPPSSTIHLYRLHVHPPHVWDVGTKAHSIQPSLLPLCDLRMQQQWDEQVSRANMDRLMDAFVVKYPEQKQEPQGSATDCKMLAASDRAGRFEIFKVDNELNSWQSVYHVDFDYPVISSLWLANTRKYGISRRQTSTSSMDATDAPAATPIVSLSTHQVTVAVPQQQQQEQQQSDTSAGASGGGSLGSWDVDPNIYIRRLPFFGPRNTQGEYALVVLTADGQLVLIYQRDEKWVRIVSPLEPKRREEREAPQQASASSGTENTDKNSSDRDDPWSNIPKGRISHADMMLVSKKWIYLAVHRAGASPVEHPHEPGAIAEELKRNGGMSAPTVEVYRIQVEFASDYSPRLFATPLVVQPATLPLSMASKSQSDSAMDVDTDADADAGSGEDTYVPRVTHIKLITALNPEVRPVDKNILGEEHYFPLLFTSLSSLSASSDFTTYIQVWKLEGAPHAEKSVIDLLRRPPPLRLVHMWTEQRCGLLLSVMANRAERQQLRYLFAKPSDKDYRALMLTWGDGKVEMLKNYQDHGDSADDDSKCFDQCVQPLSSASDWVIGSVLSPHYTTYFQLAMCPRTVDLGKKKSSKASPDSAVACAWNQGHARFRLGWTPFFSDISEDQQKFMNAPVHAYCGDLFAVRILNKEDPTDLVAILANMATHEENQLMPAEANDHAKSGSSDATAGFQIPTSRTLSQALYRACTLLANALGVKSLDLDPMASTTPFMRRLFGAIMQIHYLAQHDIQATSLGLMLHIAAVVEARVAIVHEHIIQKVSAKQQTPFDIAMSFSDGWVETFPSAAALVLWCVDLFAALARDTYLYFNARCPDSEGAMRPLCELSGSADTLVNREISYVRSFEGGAPIADSASCLFTGGFPCRLLLLLHQPTFEAIRQLMTFVAHVEFDLLKRIQVLNSLPPAAANIPEYANMIRSRDMVFSTAQQLAHALEYLPVSMHRMKDFFSEVHDLYTADEECSSLSAQTMLISTSTITGPFRKYLPQLARSFSRFVLEPDVINNLSDKPASPNALVLHDTRWMNVVMCRSNIPGLVDGAGIFETPWRVAVPVVVTDPKLIETGEDALIPAAELDAWEREKSEFERALDEDNVLFDIDDPGFIFFDTSSSSSSSSSNASSSVHTISDGVMSVFDVAARAAASAPVKITTKVPDFSDVFDPHTASQTTLLDTNIDHLFNIPMFFDAVHARTGYTEFSTDSTPSAIQPARLPFTRSNSVTTYSSYAPNSSPWTPMIAESSDTSRAAASRRRHGNVQHFVPQYSSTCSGIGAASGGELSSGWQFISTPRDPKLHVPTLLEQHAYSLAVLHGSAVRAHLPPSSSDDDGMSYCIDWARSDGIVIESPAAPGLPGLAISAAEAAASGTDSALLSKYRKQLKHTSSGSADRVDVVRKTMLSTDAQARMCLRCGHITRRSLQNGADIGWVHRFDILCVCGGSWISV
ncbi:hypothetical protein LPJ81_001187 [Coemansia sp. IMI 209127]|nr:hypothetical protein LPJ81_001187 [Coemansia sp. IMI 209127]